MSYPYRLGRRTNILNPSIETTVARGGRRRRADSRDRNREKKDACAEKAAAGPGGGAGGTGAGTGRTHLDIRCQRLPRRDRRRRGAANRPRICRGGRALTHHRALAGPGHGAGPAGQRAGVRRFAHGACGTGPSGGTFLAAADRGRGARHRDPARAAAQSAA